MPPPVRPGFGRLIAPDARDLAHPMRALTKRLALPESRLWQSFRGYVLDQGQTPHCVGFAWAGFLEAAPFMHQLANVDGDRFYTLAQTLDEWPGADYDGTSTRGGAKALQSLGLITGEYVWAQTEEDVWRFVLTRGPVVTGTTWLTGMLDTDRDGYLHATGGEEGGHDWLIIGASKARNAYRLQNSWGTSWGQLGRAWIRREDYEQLLETLGGDACSATEIKPAA
jgi:Papain family cysteine protease